jgi:hypothetical protein
MPSKFLKDVINPWLLGADPEFAILTPPDVVVPNAEPNAVNTTKAAGAIGSDHNGRVWELRPAPSPSAYVVAINLWKLLRQEELSKLEKFKWKSGALGARKSQAFVPQNQPTSLEGWVQFYNNPVNGYFGVYTAQQIAHTAKQAWHNQQAQIQAAQQAALSENNVDTLGGHVHFGISVLNAMQRRALADVTIGLLNLDILPSKENTRRLQITAHSSPKYGHLNDPDAVRDCNGHVEYRCAPSWLDRPGQALAALTAYKLAAARPSSVEWPKEQALKARFVDWLEQLSQVDVDAWVLSDFVARKGFQEIQADPASDFKSRWRKDNPWNG